MIPGANGAAVHFVIAADPTTEGQLQTVNKAGQARVTIEGQRATYRAAIKGVVVASSGVVLLLTGAANIVARLTQLVVSGTLTTAAAVDAEVIRYSTAASGGTANTPAVLPADTTDGAAACTLATYSTPPTAGTATGDLAARKVSVAAATGTEVDLSFEFGRNNGKAPTIRGTADAIGLLLTAGSWTGASIDLEIEWTESAD